VFAPREAATECVVLALAELGRTRQLSWSGPLAARTYAELTTVTADLPAGLAAAKPPTPARAQGGQSPRRPALGGGGEASRRLPLADLGGQLPPADPGHQQAAQAAPIRGARRLLLPGWRSQATTGYLTHPV
jgi:hypothetical protein